MKTRMVVHIALDAEGKRCGSLVEVCGRFIPFGGYVSPEWKSINAKEWIDRKFGTFPSIHYWKTYAKKEGFVRFQRVTLLGEAK